MRTTKELEQCILRYREAAEECATVLADSGKIEVVFGSSKQQAIDKIYVQTEEWVEKLKASNA